MELGIDKPLLSQKSPKKIEEIQEKIDKLLPEKNFYFFKKFKGDDKESEAKNKLEQE